MKKHLIAAAVAAAVVAPAAMAQNVTIYGVLDVGVAQTESKAVGKTHDRKVKDTGAEGNMAGNRIGFRGTEDLGGGLKAGFVVEMSMTPTETGSAIGATNRQSFVSLSGGFGEVAIGRFNTLTKVIQDSNTFGGPGFGIGWTTQMVGVGSTTVDNQITGATAGAGAVTLFPSLNAERVSNAVQYKTPVFNGFSASVQLVDNSDDITSTAGKVVSGKGAIYGLNYAAGPLALAVAQKSIKSTGTATTDQANTQKDEHTAFLATYDFGAAKVFVVVNDASNQAAGASLKTKFEDYSVGVRVPMGSWAFLAQYSDGEYKPTAGAKTDVKGYQLGAQYSLSKRTTAYAYYGDDEAKRTGATTGERSGFAIGVRHTF
jgi:predicted porin